MGLKKQAVDDLGKLIDLNDSEKRELNNFLKEKHCLFVVIEECKLM